MTVRIVIAALITLAACASVVATQAFDITTEIAMPSIPNIPSAEPVPVSFTAQFGSCSSTALGSLDKLRDNKHVDTADIWLIVKDVRLRSNTSFSGVETIKLELVTSDETVSVCDKELSDSDQESDLVDCEFEHRIKAEDFCSMLSGNSTGVAMMNIDLTVSPANVTLTSLSSTIEVDTELDVDVSL